MMSIRLLELDRDPVISEQLVREIALLEVMSNLGLVLMISHFAANTVSGLHGKIVKLMMEKIVREMEKLVEEQETEIRYVALTALTVFILKNASLQNALVGPNGDIGPVVRALVVIDPVPNLELESVTEQISIQTFALVMQPTQLTNVLGVVQHARIITRETIN